MEKSLYGCKELGKEIFTTKLTKENTKYHKGKIRDYDY
jgi:hypothetical protein